MLIHRLEKQSSNLKEWQREPDLHHLFQLHRNNQQQPPKSIKRNIKRDDTMANILEFGKGQPGGLTAARISPGNPDIFDTGASSVLVTVPQVDTGLLESLFAKFFGDKAQLTEVPSDEARAISDFKQTISFGFKSRIRIMLV